jgi:aminoglycoside/choline kinase family phosphotransferase
MWKEIGYFIEWFLPQHLRYTLSASEEAALKMEIEHILHNIASQPQGVVHRDYHSRNLLQIPTGLGILDFQDAVRGPLLYDPASLLKDAYIAWPEEKVWTWLHFFWQHSSLQSVPFQTCCDWFDIVCLQRHLKVLGIFARLAYRDQKKRYLNDMPRVAHYVTQALSRQTQFPALQALFQNHVTPFMVRWAEASQCVP